MILRSRRYVQERVQFINATDATERKNDSWSHVECIQAHARCLTSDAGAVTLRDHKSTTCDVCFLCIYSDTFSLSVAIRFSPPQPLLFRGIFALPTGEYSWKESQKTKVRRSQQCMAVAPGTQPGWARASDGDMEASRVVWLCSADSGCWCG